MTEEEKREAAAFWLSFFRRAVEQAVQGGYRLLILDELAGAISLGMVPEEEAAAFLKNRPRSWKWPSQDAIPRPRCSRRRAMFRRSAPCATRMSRAFPPEGESNTEREKTGRPFFGAARFVFPENKVYFTI